LGLRQPFRPRALLRLRLRVWRSAGARPDGEAPRGPGWVRAPLRGALGSRRHQDLRRGARALRVEPPREGVLGGGHEAARAAGGRVRGAGLRAALAALLLALAAQAAAASESCRTVHGRMDLWNGTPSVRIWVIGTH